MGIAKPSAIILALADIREDMTAYAAAKKHGVQQSSISRALKREASRCPTCGHVVHAKTEKAK